MKKTLFSNFLTLLIVFLLLHLLPNTFAQDNTQWGVPEGARARLGRGGIGEMQYSPDGTRLAVVGIGIWLYDTAAYQEINLLTEQSEIFSIAFSPDGKTIASGCYDGTIRLWDLGTGTYKTRLTTYKVSVNSVAFSPDGRTLACGSDDGTVRLWDAHTGEHKKTLTGHMEKHSPVGVWTAQCYCGSYSRHRHDDGFHSTDNLKHKENPLWNTKSSLQFL